MAKLSVILVLIFQSFCFSYEVSLSDEETVYSSCKISMQLIMTAQETDAVSGRAIVEVKLVNAVGSPLSGYKILLTCNRGTFLCQLPEQQKNKTDDSELDQSCFLTGQDGKIKVNLINLPLDGAVQVKASCDCGGYQVFTSGNINYNRKVIKKKR